MYKHKPIYVTSDGEPTDRLYSEINSICQLAAEEDRPDGGPKAVRGAVEKCLEHRYAQLDAMVKKALEVIRGDEV